MNPDLDPDDPSAAPEREPRSNDPEALTDAEIARLAAAIWARVVGTEADRDALDD
ncbi:MAG: hypothetical protein ACO3KD_00760 [Gaiellales bacterium]